MSKIVAIALILASGLASAGEAAQPTQQQSQAKDLLAQIAADHGGLAGDAAKTLGNLPIAPGEIPGLLTLIARPESEPYRLNLGLCLMKSAMGDAACAKRLTEEQPLVLSALEATSGSAHTLILDAMSFANPMPEAFARAAFGEIDRGKVSASAHALAVLSRSSGLSEALMGEISNGVYEKLIKGGQPVSAGQAVDVIAHLGHLSHDHVKELAELLQSRDPALRMSVLKWFGSLPEDEVAVVAVQVTKALQDEGLPPEDLAIAVSSYVRLKLPVGELVQILQAKSSAPNPVKFVALANLRRLVEQKIIQPPTVNPDAIKKFQSADADEKVRGEAAALLRALSQPPGK